MQPEQTALDALRADTLLGRLPRELFQMVLEARSVARWHAQRPQALATPRIVLPSVLCCCGAIPLESGAPLLLVAIRREHGALLTLMDASGALMHETLLTTTPVALYALRNSYVVRDSTKVYLYSKDLHVIHLCGFHINGSLPWYRRSCIVADEPWQCILEANFLIPSNWDLVWLDAGTGTLRRRVRGWGRSADKLIYAATCGHVIVIRQSYFLATVTELALYELAAQACTAHDGTHRLDCSACCIRVVRWQPLQSERELLCDKSYEVHACYSMADGTFALASGSRYLLLGAYEAGALRVRVIVAAPHEHVDFYAAERDGDALIFCCKTNDVSTHLLRVDRDDLHTTRPLRRIQVRGVHALHAWQLRAGVTAHGLWLLAEPYNAEPFAYTLRVQDFLFAALD